MSRIEQAAFQPNRAHVRTKPTGQKNTAMSPVMKKALFMPAASSSGMSGKTRASASRAWTYIMVRMLPPRLELSNG